MHTELKKRGITAETLWAKWGVWSLVSSYNHLAVKLDPQKKPSGFNQSVFLRWFAQQVPEYHKGMMAGETEETAWANVREESSDGCCGNGCRGCLKKNPGLLA